MKKVNKRKIDKRKINKKKTIKKLKKKLKLKSKIENKNTVKNKSLDITMTYNTKFVKVLEQLEIEVGILKTDSHKPNRGLEGRLQKLEKKEK